MARLPFVAPAPDLVFSRGRPPLLRVLALAVLLAGGLVLAPVSGFGVAAQQEIGPDSEGCYYTQTGNTYTVKRCPQDDGSSYYFQPDGRDGWSYFMECSVFTAFTACLWSSGLYMETYADNSRYTENAQRTYAIIHPDGTIVEGGFYDFTGAQRAISHSRIASSAMLNRSLYYTIGPSLNVQNVARANPTIFNALILPDYGNAYSNCLHLNDSQYDLDNDGRTGFNELLEYCAGR